MVNPYTLPVAVALALTASHVQSQAWSYPALQPPRLATREFNFAVADAGGGGTSVLFQWRESAGTRSQLSFDAGVAAPDTRRNDNVAFAFGQFAYQMHAASDDVPLDFLFTLGVGGAFGSQGVVRLPLGISLGHRFVLERSLTLTPWMHPRLSLDRCDCTGDNTSVAVEFDVGANLDLSRRLAVRAAFLFAGNELFSNDGFALSLAWTPPGLVRQGLRPGGGGRSPRSRS